MGLSTRGRALKNGDRPAHAWAANIGPGLATMGADTDPSGIVTYSLAVAMYGLDLLWVCFLSYPSMVALQLIATRVAAVTGNGLTENMREHYSPWLFALAVGRFLIANTLNMAADLLAMGAAGQLIFHGPIALFTVVFGGASLALQWWIPYARYARVVKWLCIALFCYGGALLLGDFQWRMAGWRAWVPDITWSESFFAMLLAVLGTTTSPYLLFSQAEQEVEERKGGGSPSQADASQAADDTRHLRRLRHETLIRTLLSNATGALILCASAATLHAQQAPFLALPPLAGSAAHAAASSFHWTRGEQRDRRIAVLLVVLTAMSAAIALCFHGFGVTAVRACYWSALVNGMTLAPVLVLLVLLSHHRKAVGQLKTHWFVRALSWLAAIATGAALAAHGVMEFV